MFGYMSKPFNLGIQTLISQDQINLENFPDITVSDFYKSHTDRRSKKMKVVNLTNIHSPELREEILCFILHCFHLRKRSAWYQNMTLIRKPLDHQIQSAKGRSTETRSPISQESIQIR